MEYLRQHERDIRLLVEAGISHMEISRYIMNMNPGVRRGLSERSVRRFCSELDIHYRSRLNTYQLDEVVRDAIVRAGHSYGRRTLQGLVRSFGHVISQERIRHAMHRVAPIPMATRRRNSHQISNPRIYVARYFGDKVHFDQNEKLVMYGVVHVMAIDGYSRKICGLISIPRKNPILIYDKLFRPLLSTVGLWDQVRVDHGTEFVLVNYVQQQLSLYRSTGSNRLPVMQTTSRNNHRVERLWVEVNQRINYPIKIVLTRMEADDELDLSQELVKFCISYIVLHVCRNALLQFVTAWNFHRIMGRNGGIPNLLAGNNRTTTLPNHVIPETSSVIATYTSSGNGRLTAPHSFGTDPLIQHPQLQSLRERDFSNHFPNMDILFESVLHNRGDLFKQALLYFISLTTNFASLI